MSIVSKILKPYSKMSFCICICASMLAAGVIVSVDASPNDTGNGRRAKADHLKKNILKKELGMRMGEEKFILLLN